MADNFDLFGNLTKTFSSALKWGKLGSKFGVQAGRHLRANSMRQEVETLYGPEVADSVEAAIRSGRDPGPIIERAKRDLAARLERDALQANPPPLYGSARWASASDLRAFLGTAEDFDRPSSILLGTFTDEGQSSPAGYIHWDGDGHLLTIAPTRSGKGYLSIIPNLLRYKGSCVVLDPKGELFEKTSAWRKENVGPVYRIAPFDDGAKGFPVDRFNPLGQVRRQSDARSLAEQMFPRDPKSPAFFADEAAGFLTAVMMYVKEHAPPHRQTLATVCQMASLKGKALLDLGRKLAAWPISAQAGHSILEKDAQRGLKIFQDTLNAKLALWADTEIQRSVSASSLSFESLKDQPATVYIDIPFHLMEPYSPWLRMVLKAALDAMLRNPNEPEIPVLFILDEFLNIGPFPEYRNAIRTHAGAGVRLWFFLQDIPSLQEHYPGNTWQPFLNCTVKQFFGIDDPYTGELIGKYLGHETVAHRATSSQASVSSQLGHWYGDASANTSWSSTDNIQFLGRPLMTPDEMMALLSGWQADGWRWSITYTRGPRAFKTQLVSYEKSKKCMDRIGAMSPEGE